MNLRVAVAAAVTASALVLSGCAQGGPPASPTSATTGGQPATTATTPVPSTTHATATSPTATTPSSTTTRTATTPATRTTSATPTPSASRPAAPVVLRVGRSAWVSVSVATLWRSPSSPRRVDEPALRSPAQVRTWLATMTLADRRGLQGRADSQMLLGDRVVVTALRTGWAKVVVPDQPTPLDARGYPGWVPTGQLTAVAPRSSGESATVVVRTAWLRSDTTAAGRLVEVSYGTRLPVLGRSGAWLRVGIPGGGVRRVDPAAVVRHPAGTPALRATAASVVRAAQSFTGLAYLWAGRSGFGLDCSGLTSLVYRVHGIVIARDADAQATGGRRVASGATAPGDLMFYATASGYVHHVSLYVGSGKMVQAPATGQSVQTIAVSTPRYAAEFAGARRYLR